MSRKAVNTGGRGHCAVDLGDQPGKLASVMRALLLIPFLLGLVSCALLGPSRNRDVSGDLRGFFGSRNETPLVLFLSDARGNGFISPDTVEIGQAGARWYYAFDLPASLKRQSGDYRVTVCVDENRNRFCDAGERRTRWTTSLLHYSVNGQSPGLQGVRPGLNEVSEGRASQWGRIVGFDLDF